MRSRVGQSLYRIFESVLPAESVQGRVGERKRSYDSATTGQSGFHVWAAVRELPAAKRRRGGSGASVHSTDLNCLKIGFALPRSSRMCPICGCPCLFSLGR